MEVPIQQIRQEDTQSSSTLLELAVVIPAWNERANLEILLPQLQEALAQIGAPSEIIVVDGGSHDGTAETAVRLGARAVQQTKRGYGGALSAGFAQMHARYVVTMDADVSHPAGFIARFWEERQNADVLIASRYVPGGTAEMSSFRYVLSRILNVTFAVLLMLPLKDLSSGFRMYRREALESMDLVSQDFDVLEELIVKAYIRGWKIREIPFHYATRVEGRSHARLLKFGVAYLRTIARMMRERYLRRGGTRRVSAD
jgi:dolichol-phosphate mannosyltransferase